MYCLQFILIPLINLLVVVNGAIEIPLSIGWTITNQNQSIQIQNEQIPSGVYSALERANITESVLKSFNDVNLRWIGKENWKYSLIFDVDEEIFNHAQTVLVFHGLDTIATITLNNHKLLPNPNNMFVRYRYNVRDKLIRVNNNLEIEFQSPITAAKQYATENAYTPPECPPARYKGECHMNMLRKMQASFSWDWGLAAPSIGIWKPVTLEVYDSAIIRDVTYALQSIDQNDWQINVNVYMEYGVGAETFQPLEGCLSLELIGVSDVPSIKKCMVITNVEQFKETLSFTVPKRSVKRWWPNGYGEQMLYSINVSWLGENRNILTNEIKQIPIGFLQSEKIISIGFRTIELCEEATGTGNLFYFKVNDVPIFMKGTNFIPSDILPEKMFDIQKIEYLILAAKEAHMNSIRVWGGGVYESDDFYDLTDRHGILIWQDMMFACAMYPVNSAFLASVEEEIVQNMRRLQRHPSILVWAGNNENEAALVQNWYGTRSEMSRFSDEYIQLYRDIVETAVLENVGGPWLYSSPSNGNQTNRVINKNPQDNNYGDVHYYNYILDGWNSNIFPKSRFISEYGFQSIPSLHSWHQTAHSNDSLDNLINHRQHFPYGSLPIINQITFHLPMPRIDSNYWSTFIYFSQISQAMSTKTETETYRIGRYFEWKTMGALYWQLNDVWIAPSWSSIEYNGNFKVLQYWAKDFFAPLHIIANLDAMESVNVFVVRDTLGESQELNVRIRTFIWSTLNPVSDFSFDVLMPSNTVDRVLHKPLKDILNGGATEKNSLLQFILTDKASGEILATNFLFLDKLKKCEQITNPHLQFTIKNQNCDRKSSVSLVEIEINVTAPAIFVYVQLKNQQIETYKLSKNGFIQLMPKDSVTITFYNRNCAMAFTNDDIQILTVNDFLSM